MTYKFNKKNKLKLYFFLTFLFFLTIINYIYQVNFVKHIYSVNITLRNNLNYEVVNDNTFNESQYLDAINGQIKRSQNITSAMEKYDRNLQLSMESKINYERDYDKNLIQLNKICIKLGLQVQGNYLFVSCLTANPNNIKTQIIKNLSKVMLSNEKNIDSIIMKKILSDLGVKLRKDKDDIFVVIKEKIISTKNHIKNIIKLNLIFAFLFAMIVFIKIKKITF